jgi:hypothetical protein
MVSQLFIRIILYIYRGAGGKMTFEFIIRNVYYILHLSLFKACKYPCMYTFRTNDFMFYLGLYKCAGAKVARGLRSQPTLECIVSAYFYIYEEIGKL